MRIVIHLLQITFIHKQLKNYTFQIFFLQDLIAALSIFENSEFLNSINIVKIIAFILVNT